VSISTIGAISDDLTQYDFNFCSGASLKPTSKSVNLNIYQLVKSNVDLSSCTSTYTDVTLTYGSCTVSGNVATRLYIEASSDQHIFRESSTNNVTIQGAGFVDTDDSKYSITIQGQGCDFNQATYVSGVNVSVYVDENASYLIIENAKYSGCESSVQASVVYSDQPSTDIIQIGTAVYLTDTTTTAVVVLYDTFDTPLTVQGSGFVHSSDPSLYTISVSCGNVSLGDTVKNCIPYNTADDSTSGYSTTTLIGKISSSKNAASTCGEGAVIYASLAYSGQSSESVAVGYVLGLSDTSTSIAITGSSTAETITLSGVGFVFDVSNTSLTYTNADVHSLSVKFSSDTCGPIAATLANVPSSTTLVTATAILSGCSSTVTAQATFIKKFAVNCDDTSISHDLVMESTQNIGFILTLLDTSTSQGVQASDSSYVITLQGTGFVGLSSDYSLILSGCEDGAFLVYIYMCVCVCAFFILSRTQELLLELAHQRTCHQRIC